ncbi:uncharacterized protein BDW70DRAFT_152302 [Aspergillus foveolatus]|uniref:uncharacterized protein n=1 Tax=Aspergillus foveolatus TaxID=210207 RepID=UPI003CCE26CF
MGLMRYHRRHHVPVAVIVASSCSLARSSCLTLCSIAGNGTPTARGQLRLTTRRKRNTTAKPLADCSMPAMQLRCALCKAQGHCGPRSPLSVPGAEGASPRGGGEQPLPAYVPLITSNNTTHDFPTFVRTSGYQSVGMAKAFSGIWAVKLQPDTGMAWHGVAWRGAEWLRPDLVLAQTLRSAVQTTTASKSLKIVAKVRLADYPQNIQSGHVSGWTTISTGDSGDRKDGARTAISALESGPGRMMYGSNLARKSPVVDPSEAS